MSIFAFAWALTLPVLESAEAGPFRSAWNYCLQVLRSVNPKHMEEISERFLKLSDEEFLEHVISMSQTHSFYLPYFVPARDFLFRTVSEIYPGNFKTLNLKSMGSWTEWGFSVSDLESQDWRFPNRPKFRNAVTAIAIKRKTKHLPIAIILIHRDGKRGGDYFHGEKITYTVYFYSDDEMQSFTRETEVEFLNLIRP